MKKRTISQHEDAICVRTFTEYLRERGLAATIRRAYEIKRLPTVQWHGRTLYTLRCDADFGRGPHAYNLPESYLWNLINLRRFRCAYHR